MRRLLRVLPILTTTVVIGCVPMVLQRPATPPAARDGAVVEVTNKNFEDLVVYWRKGEIDIPLGVASGMTTGRFVIPPALMGNGLGVQLAIGPRGQRASRVSSVFDAGPRATVSWIVDYRLGTSAVVVR